MATYVHTYVDSSSSSSGGSGDGVSAVSDAVVAADGFVDLYLHTQTHADLSEISLVAAVVIATGQRPSRAASAYVCRRFFGGEEDACWGSSG